MTLKVASLKTLDADLVQQNHALLRQLMQELNPNIDVLRGVLDDHLNYLGAILDTAVETNVSLSERSRSLLEITKSPALADDEIVDSVLSNFRITRKTGTKASGNVTIVVSKLSSVTIAKNTTLTANGLQFRTTNAFVAKTTVNNVIEETDRLLTPTVNGNYSFIVDVEALAEGQESRLAKDTTLTLSSPPLNFVEAYVTSDFQEGEDPETNEELLARLDEGVTSAVMAGRASMLATITSFSEFSRIVSSSIIGMGQPEMLRDKHWIFPIGGGGRVDWYIRPQQQANLTAVTVEATLIEKTNDGKGIWQFSLTRTQAPGFYDIVQIVPTTDEYTGTYEITEDIRGFDISESETLPSFIPDIETASEAAYSRYQTATIKFRDIDRSTADLDVGDKADYIATLRGFPLIAEIQDKVNLYTIHHPAGDVLVKAPIPCFVQLSFTIQRLEGTEEPDIDTIKNELAAVINLYGFKGKLPASVLTDKIHNYLAENQYCSAIDMHGTIRTPAGEKIKIRSTELLEIPNLPEDLVTPRTVCFITSPSDIGVSDEIVDSPEE